MRKLVLSMLLIIFYSYSYSQGSFTANNSNEVKEKVKSILIEKKRFSSLIKAESIFISDLIKSKTLGDESNDGVYIVNTDAVHIGNFLLFKDRNNFILFYSIPELEKLFDEVLNIRGLDKRDKKKYLKNLYHYYVYFLERKSKKELFFIPKDSASYADVYKKKKKRKYSKKKRDIKKKYKEFLKKVY